MFLKYLLTLSLSNSVKKIRLRKEDHGIDQQQHNIDSSKENNTIMIDLIKLFLYSNWLFNWKQTNIFLEGKQTNIDTHVVTLKNIITYKKHHYFKALQFQPQVYHKKEKKIDITVHHIY